MLLSVLGKSTNKHVAEIMEQEGVQFLDEEDSELIHFVTSP